MRAVAQALGEYLRRAVTEERAEELLRSHGIVPPDVRGLSRVEYVEVMRVRSAEQDVARAIISCLELVFSNLRAEVIRGADGSARGFEEARGSRLWFKRLHQAVTADGFGLELGRLVALKSRSDARGSSADDGTDDEGHSVARREGLEDFFVRVFISHSRNDEELVKHFVELLGSAWVFHDDQIRCTSVPGHSLAIGDMTAATLRADLRECDLVIGIMTPASVRSPWVLFELGAAWGLAKHSALLLSPDVAYTDIEGPFSGQHHARLADEPQLVKFLEDQARALDWRRRSADKLSSAARRFTRQVASSRRNEA